MSHIIFDAVPPSVPANRSRGASAESDRVDESYVEAWRTSLNFIGGTVAVEQIKARLEALERDHAVRGWDGYDAQPIPSEAIARAFEFVLSLPPAYAGADISASPFGEVEMEWYVQPDRILTLSIGAGGRYAYAGLNGRERYSGAGYIAGVPPRLLRDVRGIVTE